MLGLIIIAIGFYFFVKELSYMADCLIYSVDVFTFSESQSQILTQCKQFCNWLDYDENQFKE